MKQMNEDLLDAWLRLSTVINNERVVSDVPYNESLICNILYRNQVQTPDRQLTATDLCNETRMLKSQMNRTLNSMEEKGFIRRERSATDKRQVLVFLDMEQIFVYQNQHSRILKLLDTIIERLGADKALETIQLLNQITNIANEVL